jgi:predicted N-acyltransferase
VRILINNEIPADDWTSFFKANAFATPFQSYDFYNIANSCAGLSAEAVAVSNGGQILALSVITLLKNAGLFAFFSHRAIIFGGPLADTGCPEALDLLVGHITDVFKGRVIYLETRNLADYGGFKKIFEKNQWEYIPYLNFNLQTGDHDKMIKALSESRLRQIKRAKFRGVTWREAVNLQEVRTFFDILSELYRKKIRKPLLPWEFFKISFEKRFGIFLLVIYDGKIIGGIMCPVLEKKSIYEFYICGLDNEHREQCPSIMATWAAMEYACENGIQRFDFMGAGRPEESYGVRDFKARFGGEVVEYGRFLKIMKPLLYKTGTLAMWLLSTKRQ